VDKQVEEAGFTSLVTSFYIAGLQQLGKVASPITGKTEKNLEQAKYTIELLIMLREKTKGNLTKEEEESLKTAIANLQLNYVEEVNAQKDSGKEGD